MSKQQVHEVLTKAQNLIRDPKNWMQGWFARDEHGMGLPNGADTRATCFCSMGALQRAVYLRSPLFDNAYLALAAAAYELSTEDMTVPVYNDRHTHEEVMAMWDRAKEIALAAAA
ncbi:hypothetical protein C3Y94_025845 [Rhizobium ruizarguesonis]|uniref:DUF6197 family protein n=1 Tax=Rhizobium ruizarguesonis TaxID=2081791 RepID=UPI00163AB219|nr:hypothetical protein [Rhizobium ruizarguesonis]MBC2806577.1 hypothetical protein [Rhizobium ruizarguesonis]